MQNWKNKFSSIKVRFAAVVIAIMLLFSTLLIEPAMVRLFGTPVLLTYQADFVNPGSEVFARLNLLQVPVDQLPESIQDIYAMDDFDEAIQRMNEQSFYVTLVEVDGIYVRQSIELTPPDQPYVVASFDWFLDDQTRNWNDANAWQDRYLGITLRTNTVQRYFVPRDVSLAQRTAIEEGTATARYILYRNTLYLIDPIF